MPTILPFGSWPSPLTARTVAESAPRIDGARFVGDDVWWSESMPHEQGRTAIRSRALDRTADDETSVVLPAPWSARSRVHEYGGGAWTVDEDATLYFVEQSDQRVWMLVRGGSPRALTASAPGSRYGDLTWAQGHLLAVREVDGENGAPARDIVEIATTPGDSGALPPVTRIAAGYDFLAYPRLSPTGDRLAFIGWNRPSMPWDSTHAVVLELASGHARVVAGGAHESVLQPEWTGEDELTYSTDGSGRWTLERCRLDAPAESTSEHAGAASSESAAASMRADEAAPAPETGGPLWNLGARWFAPLDDHRIVAVQTYGRDELVLSGSADAMRTLPTPLSAQVLIRDVRGARVLVTGAGEADLPGLWLVDVDQQAPARALHGGRMALGADWLAPSQAVTYDGPNGPVHAFDYPPAHPSVHGPAGELPPYIVTVHGGPTAHVGGAASPAIAYFTSRGIGVLDVNYAGSSGYGRAYRNRLRGQWGIADVRDVVAAAEGLVASGRADAKRLAIKGSSAGGWTVLSALTAGDTFSAGISRYGVADLFALAKDTHDFEAHYLEGLVGALPADESVYNARSPLGRVDRLRAPVLLLQGADDPVVPPAQAHAVRDALAARGIPHALVLYEGESHGFRRAETIEHALESELSFLGQVFGFATPGVPALVLST